MIRIKTGSKLKKWVICKLLRWHKLYYERVDGIRYKRCVDCDLKEVV